MSLFNTLSMLMIALFFVGCGSSSSGGESYIFSGSSSFNMKSVVTESEFEADIGQEVDLNISVTANSTDDSLVDIIINGVTKTVGMENGRTFKFSLVEDEDGGVTTSIITIKFDSDDLSTFDGVNSWKFRIDNQDYPGISEITGTKTSGNLQFTKE